MDVHGVGLFKLKHVQLPSGAFNSFFYLNQSDLPGKFSYGSSNVVPLQLRFGDDLDKSFFTSLGPFNAQVARRQIGACAIVFKRLGLKEHDEIFVSICRAKSLSVIAVRPKCQDDYNIMVSSHGIMEQIMLNQVRIVGPQQPLVLQIGSVVIDLVVASIKPQLSHGRLEPHTEVIVTDLESNSVIDSVPEDDSMMTRLLKHGLRLIQLGSLNDEDSAEKSPKQILTEAFKQQSEVEPYRVVLENQNIADNIVYTSVGFHTDQPTPCRVTKVQEKTDNFSKVLEKSDKTEENKPFYCMLMSRNSTSCHKEIYFSETFMNTYALTIGSRLVIEPLQELPMDAKLAKTNIPNNKLQDNFLWTSVRKTKHQIMDIVGCCARTGFAGNILVTGPLGCGKTYLMKDVSKACFSRNIHCCIVDCKTMRGKKVESLVKMFTRKWSECGYREPSVIILDDLDSFNSQVEEFDESEMGGIYGRRLSTSIIELTERFGKIGRIQLIATADSVTSLASTLASVRGPRLFSTIIEIPELTLKECGEILTNFGVPIDEEMLEKTHGFRVQDLSDLASRAKLRAFLDGRKETIAKDIQDAFEDTIPRALQGIQLKTVMPYSWNDVGGMEDVKKTLIEIFRWPSKYPEIFTSSPLRLQTGALLYGPPGCGKTLIAGALANECGMNFKSVKGPELLSKYIGESEAAVRELFNSANQAQPCLLFFDELDSLAPRRGAESTGVTDRVVNQLLTELDGVEGRSGVWVLGATSRPDLIDPALLRPGRLDRIIFCPVPSLECRLQILQVLSQDLNISSDVQLTDLVSKTEGFTGADLQALLYNCQMKAIKEYPDSAGNVDLLVTSSHIEAALLESRSSLTATENHKYNQIYQRFQSAKTSEDGPKTYQAQRVTSA